MTGVNFTDHYWRIAPATTNLYSSKSNTIVPDSDPTFQAWFGTVSDIGSEAELAEMLRTNHALPDWLFTADTFIQPTATTYTKTQLAAYSADARWRKQMGGIIVSGKPFNTTTIAQSDLNTAYIYAQNNPTATFNWKLADGEFVVLDAPSVIHAHDAHTAYTESCYNAEKDTAAAITAGTMTDLAAIDAAYAAISNVFP